MYLAEGREYPEQFGGNCVFMTRQLTRKLLESGLAPQYIFASNRTHWSAVCREGKHTYQLDPFLLHEEPIPISKIIQNGKQAVFDAHPIVNGHPSKIAVQPKSAHEFSVSVSGFRGETYQTFRRYEYDLRQTLTDIPRDWRQPRDTKESTYLNMRTLDPDGQVTSMYLYEEGFMTAKTLGGRKLKQRSDPEFHDLMSRIAGQLRTDVDRLMRFFYDAQGIYRERSATHSNT